MPAGEPALEPATGKEEENYQGANDISLPVNNSEITQVTQHFLMATPPGQTRNPDSRAELCSPPPGLAPQEYPEQSSDMPSRHEERTIAQRDLATAKSNLKCSFGQEIRLDQRNPAI